MSNKQNDDFNETTWDIKVEQGISYLETCGFKLDRINRHPANLFTLDGVVYILEDYEVIGHHDDGTLPEGDE